MGTPMAPADNLCTATVLACPLSVLAVSWPRRLGQQTEALLCRACSKQGCFAADQTVAKVYYFIAFGLTVVVSWALRDYAENLLKHLPELETCFSSQANGQPGECTGKGAVLRISFGNFIFFAAHFLLTLGCRKKTDPRKFLHTGCLTLQTLVWAGVIGSTFAMPNNLFYVWGQIARVLGAIFLVIQIILILDFIFIINEYLIDKEACHFVLIAGSASLYLGSLAFIGLAYYYYAPNGGCRLNIFFITWTLIMGIFITVLSVSPIRIQSAGLLSSGMTLAYAVFLLWSALGSEADTYSCVAHRDSGQGEVLRVVGFVVALVSVVLATFFASTEASNFNVGSEKSEDSLDYPPDFFHMIYGLASAYVAMLFLGWSLTNVPGKTEVDKGWISVWFHMASQWLSFVLYIWLLIAPRVLQGRDFGSSV